MKKNDSTKTDQIKIVKLKSAWEKRVTELEQKLHFTLQDRDNTAHELSLATIKLEAAEANLKNLRRTGEQQTRQMEKAEAAFKVREYGM